MISGAGNSNLQSDDPGIAVEIDAFALSHYQAKVAHGWDRNRGRFRSGYGAEHQTGHVMDIVRFVLGVGIRCEPEVWTDVKQNVAVEQPLSGPFGRPGQSERPSGRHGLSGD